MTALAALLIFALCFVLPVVGELLAMRNKGNCDD